MANGNNRPVVFFAFANDQNRYLRNLPEERREVTRALGEAEGAGLCELAPPLSNATLEELFTTFNNERYRNRIAVFHYGGHAGDYALQLESRAGDAALAHAQGLAEFLGQQRGLVLVFLNGCSTGPQVEDLLTAGVPAVIATSQAIHDKVARAFAAHFYQALGGGDSVRGAFNRAVAGTKAARGNTPRNLYKRNVPLEATDRWPWELYLKPGADLAADWNLPDSVDDPLFGLPAIPRMDLPAEPYRHLLPFTRDHAEIFFGRGHAIRELYTRITGPDSDPIILLYGQSGVGKSSLLDAGLRPRLELTHKICYRRREQSLGLLGTLREELDSQGLDSQGEESLASVWHALEAVGQPVVVILDQVEEIFTRPRAVASDDEAVASDDELDQFLAALVDVFGKKSHRPQGKLVLSFRKDWLAEVEGRLNKGVGTLPYRKVPLKPLDPRGIIEAITGPTKSARLQERYGLSIEGQHDDDGYDLPSIIANNFVEDVESPVAPTLQILLKKMWDGAKIKAAEQGNPEHPRFDRDLYRALANQGIALRKFRDQQLRALRRWREEVVTSGFALDLLEFHTTSMGTAEQRTSADLANAYPHREDLPEIVQRCKDLYLLTDPLQRDPQPVPGPRTRLGHDTLAPLIRERFDTSTAPGQRARRILENRVVDWRNGREGTPLDERDLDLVERGARGMRAWTEDEQRLVLASRVTQQQEQDAERQLAKEREEDRRQLRIALRQAGKAIRRLRFALGMIAIVAGIALWQYDAANGRRAEADRQTREALTQLSRYLANEAQTGRASAPIRSLLLAIEAVNTTRQPYGFSLPMAEKALQTSFSNTGVINLQPMDWVGSVAFSPDGHLLASESTSYVLLYDLNDLRAQPQELRKGRQSWWAASFAFSFDDRWLASASDESVWLYDLSSLQDEPIVLQGDENPVNSVAFSPDGHWLASAGEDATVRLWNLNDLEAVPRVLQHEDVIVADSVAFSPDGHWLALGSGTYEFDGVVLLYDLSSLQDEPIALRGHEDRVRSVAFSPDGQWLASAGGEDGTVRLWDLADPQAEPQGRVLQHEDVTMAHSVAFSPDGHWLALGRGTFEFDYGVVLLYDLSSLQDEPIALRGHEKSVFSVAFSPDGLLASGGQDGVRLWPIDYGKFFDLACRTAGRNLTQNEWLNFMGELPYRRTCPDLPPGVGESPDA